MSRIHSFSSIFWPVSKPFAYRVCERFYLGGKACDVRLCSRFAAFISGSRVRTLAVWQSISGLGLGWRCTSLIALQNSGNVGNVALGARLMVFCTACTTYKGCWPHPLLAVMACTITHDTRNTWDVTELWIVHRERKFQNRDFRLNRD